MALIWKMLKAGYMEQWVYNCTFSGTPQGSGVSPMLANIYLSKLDEFAERLKKEFSKGKSKDNLEYSRAASKLYYIRRRNRANWDSWNEQQRKEALRLQKDAISYKHSLPSKRANNEDYKSLVYCRYADDFLIGVIGSFEDASEIKDKFRVFLEDTLHLEMSEEKTKITHSQDKARFLGYDITTAKNSALMQSSGHTEMPIQAVGQEQPVPDDKGASGNMDYTEEDVKKYQMDPDINELLDFSFCGE